MEDSARVPVLECLGWPGDEELAVAMDRRVALGEQSPFGVVYLIKSFTFKDAGGIVSLHEYGGLWKAE